MQSNSSKLGKWMGLAALSASLASGVCHAASTAVISGVVRDTHGVAQMGAMVQVLATTSATVATAFTDIYGRYRITSLVPGRYHVRATAALFVPATRSNLQLSTGMRATVNLTLNMLSDPAVWLPAKRRGPDEPGDDWTWTLRSAANRPILRMLDDGEVVLTSSGSESHQSPVMARASIVGGAGGFGAGGLHNVLALDRKTGDGSDIVMRSDVAVAHAGHLASAEVDAGYQRKAMFGNASRLVVNYSSHPEIGSGIANGLQMVRMASAQRMELGDLVGVEAGGTVYAIHMDGNAIVTRPFVRVSVHPGEVWAVEYRLATARDLQDYDGLDSIKAGLPAVSAHDGRISAESGKHQEIAVSRRAGSGSITAAVYRDVIAHAAVSGAGAMSDAELAGSTGLTVDGTSDTFRLLGSGYAADGVSISIAEPLTQSLWAALEYASGGAMAPGTEVPKGLAETTASLHMERADALTASLKSQVARTGTKLHASYRWQPKLLVTAIAPYDTLSDQAYFSFYVRQALRWGDRLPAGLEATVDVTNLLAEGYQPFLSADGRTLYLAEAPRTVQAGLSFTF